MGRAGQDTGFELVMREDEQAQSLLRSFFEVAVKAADPDVLMAAHLPERPKGRVIVVGAGKAASQMAAAFERAWDGPCEGVVVARHGPVAQTRSIKVLTAAHPLPDAQGLLASQKLLDAVSGLTVDDLVIALISGGGSALLPAPPDGFSLEDEITLTEALLRSGAPIAAMNCIRQHFSKIKGGRLAVAAAPARVVTLIVSDIPGDEPAYVASGPTIPSSTTADDARAVMDDYGIVLPESIRNAIGHAHAPKPDDPVFQRHDIHIIASARKSLEAAQREAQRHGLEAVILSDAIEGEASDIGMMHAAIAREIAMRDRPFAKPVLLLSGGETTVTLRDHSQGRGGRNSEFLLSFALGIQDIDHIHALAADTDGIDGTETNAGAFADGHTTRKIRQSGLDPRALLRSHCSYDAFERINALFVTGPTGTNVNDFRALLIGH